MPMIRVNARHLTTPELNAEVHAVANQNGPVSSMREISDGCAVTIAAGWQSSGRVGSAFAALASGAEVDTADVFADITATYRYTDAVQRQELDLLGTWLVKRANT